MREFCLLGLLVLPPVLPGSVHTHFLSGYRCRRCCRRRRSRRLSLNTTVQTRVAVDVAVAGEFERGMKECETVKTHATLARSRRENLDRVLRSIARTVEPHKKTLPDRV